MYCQECGTKNIDEAKFCARCGAPMVTVDEDFGRSAASYESFAGSNGANGSYAQGADPVEHGYFDEADVPPSQREQTATESDFLKKLSAVPKIFWGVLAAACCLVALIAVFFNSGKAAYSPEKLAARYFVNLVNGNYDTVFSELGITSDEFINEESCRAYCETLGLGDVTDYTVTEYTGGDYSDRIGDLMDEFGLGDYYDEYVEGETEDEPDESVSESRIYQISYSTSDGIMSSMYVTVNLTGGKNLLFFDKWSVDSSSALVENYHVIVPKGATVTFDGAEVSAAYITTSTDDLYYADLMNSDLTDSYEVYLLPKVMIGDHTITVKSGEYAESTQTVSISSDGDGAYITDLSYNQETLESLNDLAAANAKRIYQAAAKGASFSTIKDLFTEDEETLSSIEESYGYLVSFFEDESIKSFTIDKINTRSDGSSAAITVTLSYTVEYEYSYWWYSTDEVRTYEGTSDCSFSFELSDGEFLQTSLGAQTLYY
ncbi:MAG: zinc ribbon domain-containing protein [Eubacterium sp.]|nr:zinc ribbon domain-containing protein [Eubacterium sp.]